jgi:crotonobetainyl-CoA:carnitine CoA-transferase CaiB-like acyl-CoA transferase
VNQAMNHLVGGLMPQRLGNAHPNVVPYRDFQTADGHVLITCGNTGQFKALCALLGLESVAADERFQQNDGRLADRDELEATLGRAIATWTSADLFAAMDRFGVPGGPINRIDQVFQDEQVKARGLVHPMTRADGTVIEVVGYPSQLSRTPATYRVAPQRQGQDTAAVLQEQLGLDAAEIERMVAGGIVST